MIDAAKYDKIETLKNGTAVRVRSVRPDDKNRISEAFRNLETESIYTRFFQHKKALTEEELKAATEVDFENVLGWWSRSEKEQTKPSSQGDATRPSILQTNCAAPRCPASTHPSTTPSPM